MENTITFPIVNISIKKWRDKRVVKYLRFDEYTRTYNNSLFKKYYKNKLFCDSEGFIYQAIKKEKMKEKWRNWFRFIPNVWKTKIIYKPTGKEMKLEDLRKLLLDRISHLSENHYTRMWKDKIKKAKTHYELING